MAKAVGRGRIISAWSSGSALTATESCTDMIPKWPFDIGKRANGCLRPYIPTRIICVYLKRIIYEEDGMNKLMLSGALMKKPELRNTSNGDYVTNFIVKVKREGSNKQDYLRCSAWNDKAKKITSQGKAGCMVYVIGEVHQHRYFSTSLGREITSFEVIAKEIDINPSNIVERQFSSVIDEIVREQRDMAASQHRRMQEWKEANE
jgi:single-stranded DNA-binding protein